MIKLGKKSKLGLGMMIAGGAMMTMGAMVLNKGRKLDKEIVSDLCEEELWEEWEEPVCFTKEDEIEAGVEEVEDKEVFSMKDIDKEIAATTEDNDIEYNPKADHKAMTQAELESQSDFGTF